MTELTYTKAFQLVADVIKDYPDDKAKAILNLFQRVFEILDEADPDAREGVLKIFFKAKDAINP